MNRIIKTAAALATGAVIVASGSHEYNLATSPKGYDAAVPAQYRPSAGWKVSPAPTYNGPSACYCMPHTASTASAGKVGHPVLGMLGRVAIYRLVLRHGRWLRVRRYTVRRTIQRAVTPLGDSMMPNREGVGHREKESGGTDNE